MGIFLENTLHLEHKNPTAEHYANDGQGHIISPKDTFTKKVVNCSGGREITLSLPPVLARGSFQASLNWTLTYSGATRNSISRAEFELQCSPTKEEHRWLLKNVEIFILIIVIILIYCLISQLWKYTFISTVKLPMGMVSLGNECKPRKLPVLNGLVGILASRKANQATGLMIFLCV